MNNRAIQRAMSARHIALLATSALATFGTPAFAEGTPDFMMNVAQGTGAVPASDMMVEHLPQVVISEPGTPTTARDTNDVTGIGQMIIDQKTGFLGLCTGTLINPRTVIFAAHCVNESPQGTAMNPWGYGTGAGQLPIGFGFKADNLAGIRSWFLAGTNQYKTSVGNAFYNVNQVIYNPQSLSLGLANNFLQADVALASLDTPARNVPTWTILLSQLPAPGTITSATGTGYHVIEAGYGRNGTGTSGDSGGIDYRRRVAENFIGILGSLDDIDSFLFGSPSGLTQNLYQTDFDDPKRGLPGANAYDFNIFKDNALPKEGITAGGDSGGPLILDKTFSKPTVIGVLSGGSRYFNAQPSSSYGTSSFYQPLYLFWDYIAANNPYRYVAAKAGDGDWFDASHWVTTLDPAYQIIVNGQLVNGIPTAPGDGINGTSGKFGQICYQQGRSDECLDIGTNTYLVNGRPVPADTVVTGGATLANNKSVASFADGLTSINEAQGAGNAQAIAAAAAALPTATLANGLPGATNFVPNNVDPDAATRRNARYFDVTLSNAGTTTLSGTATVDRFTINNQAKLTVASGGSLSSLMEFNQFGGLVTANGTINSVGDYFLLSGGLTGTGRINAPYLTSLLGMIAPGTQGTVGTLTIGGNAVLSSGNLLMVDIAGNNTSDRLAVVANGTSTGQASIGGRVLFSPVAGSTIRFGDVYTILTAQGGISGTFATPSALSAILTPQFVYSANTVQARITAGRYADVVAATPIQSAYARLLDQNRATNYAALSGIYGPLDLQNAATIRSNLEGLAPRAETTKRALGTVALDNMGRFYRDRLAQMDLSNGLGGTLAMTGKPLQFASLAASDMPMTGAQLAATDSPQTTLQTGVLPESVSAFVAGGYLDGSSRAAPTAIPFAGRDQFDGWYAAGGIETEIGDNGALGFGLSYTNVSGDQQFGQRAKGELWQGTLYGKLESPTGLFLDTQVSAGVFQARTRRAVSFVGTDYTLRSRDNAFAFTSEVGLGKNFNLGTLKVGPRLSARTSQIDFTPTVERGGPVGLFLDRQKYNSLQGRAGLALSGGARIKPYVSAYYVHDFQDRPGSFGANFVGGVGPSAIFALPGQDKNWGEVSGGISVGGERIELSVGADTTFERSDVRNQSYRAAVKVRF